MAIAISKTPRLKSRESEKFQKLANENRNKCAPKKEVTQAIKTFMSVMSGMSIVKK